MRAAEQVMMVVSCKRHDMLQDGTHVCPIITRAGSGMCHDPSVRCTSSTIAAINKPQQSDNAIIAADSMLLTQQRLLIGSQTRPLETG